MKLDEIKIGMGITGSFCTLSKIMPQIEELIKLGVIIYPIISETVNSTDTRFCTALQTKVELERITKNKVISSIIDAEPIGPQKMLDVMVIAPCTGNTISKIVNGITDTAVTMACKAHLRNQRPVVICVSTNDGLSTNAKNIGMLLNTKNIYLVPFKQDDPINKPNSIIADTEMIIPTIIEAMHNRQIQPVLGCSTMSST